MVVLHHTDISLSTESWKSMRKRQKLSALFLINMSILIWDVMELQNIWKIMAFIKLQGRMGRILYLMQL